MHGDHRDLEAESTSDRANLIKGLLVAIAFLAMFGFVIHTFFFTMPAQIKRGRSTTASQHPQIGPPDYSRAVAEGEQPIAAIPADADNLRAILIKAGKPPTEVTPTSQQERVNAGLTITHKYEKCK